MYVSVRMHLYHSKWQYTVVVCFKRYILNVLREKKTQQPTINKKIEKRRTQRCRYTLRAHHTPDRDGASE